MYRYAVLDAKKGKGFAPLTYDRYRPFLKGEIESERIISIGAYHLLQPVGLIVAGYDLQTKQGSILSLTVLPDHQNYGIGIELLRRIEEMIIHQGCESIDANYVGDNEPLERLFAKRGWNTPQTIGFAIECNANSFMSSPIYLVKPELPQGFEAFAWMDLTAEDRAAIQAREALPGGWYSATGIPGSVSPFIEEQFLEPRCSIGLRHEGNVVGWMIVHRLREDMLHFICLFVSAEYRRHNLGILLVMVAVQRTFEVYQPEHPDMRVFWQFRIENKVMAQMVETHLAPYAIDFKREKSAQKLCI